MCIYLSSYRSNKTLSYLLIFITISLLCNQKQTMNKCLLNLDSVNCYFFKIYHFSCNSLYVTFCTSTIYIIYCHIFFDTVNSIQVQLSCCIIINRYFNKPNTNSTNMYYVIYTTRTFDIKKTQKIELDSNTNFVIGELKIGYSIIAKALRKNMFYNFSIWNYIFRSEYIIQLFVLFFQSFF